MPKSVVSKELEVTVVVAVGDPVVRVAEEGVGVPEPGTGCSR